ncbi:MAG: isoprenylcysteine carboxylmethyltransferase family protein [Sphingomonas sp.]|nr:isoprenylcysteine carboxylmethyltransferase family protein [Sphingomonas sp.]
MAMFAHYPVGLPGLIAFGVGGLLFFGALFATWLRGRQAPKAADGQRDRRSILWIALQGVAIGIAGAGRIRVDIVPDAPLALTQAAIVLILMLSAAVLFDRSSRAMGKNWALVARTRDDATLVTGGPFAFVRNPIYVALALFMTAMAIAYGRAANLVIAFPVYAFATRMRVASEEKVLRAQFGPAYDAYAARVSRFLPGII